MVRLVAQHLGIEHPMLHFGLYELVTDRMHRIPGREHIVLHTQAQHRTGIGGDAAVQVLAQTTGLIAVGFCHGQPVRHQRPGLTAPKTQLLSGVIAEQRTGRRNQSAEPF